MTANLPPLSDSSQDPRPVDPTVDRSGDPALRDLAVDRLKKKAEFRMHVLIYALVNGMIVLIWAMTGAGFFWPVFPLAGWGIGLVAHAVETFGHDTPTEDEISQEMDRLRRR